ncbi:nucleotidyltransferase family protein [Jannaschia sp. LMIT008]|uniref:nucleotidyltransferase family protein n=1 Tax=Jannaschia maritima TaxID=3032585 RepID=UPI002811D689|nr:nucleotidyltransferase family protein [Jannaschia sp. LMIT008]
MTLPAMVFAAGLGTRMRPLTDDRPKAMVPVAGRPLIDHALDQVAGCTPVVVNVHHHPAPLRAHLADRDVTVSEEPDLLDTGGGLRHALPLLGGDPVLTMNADAAWTGPRAADTLRAAWDPARMDGLMLLTRLPRRLEAGRRAFAIAPDGRLSLAPDGYDYTGAGIFRTGGLADLPPGPVSLLRLWEGMLAAGRMFGVVHPGGWMDVGRPGNVAAAETMLARNA